MPWNLPAARGWAQRDAAGQATQITAMEMGALPAEALVPAIRVQAMPRGSRIGTDEQGRHTGGRVAWQRTAPCVRYTSMMQQWRKRSPCCGAYRFERAVGSEALHGCIAKRKWRCSTLTIIRGMSAVINVYTCTAATPVQNKICTKKGQCVAPYRCCAAHLVKVLALAHADIQGQKLRVLQVDCIN